MRAIIILGLALVLSGGLSVFGLSVEIPVTTNSLNQGQCVFSVSNNAVKSGMAFQVTITAKTSDIISNSTSGICIVTHWKNSRQIIGAQPAIPVTVTKSNKVETVHFILSHESLINPDLCFVFTVQDFGVTQDGQRIDISSPTFYEIKLRDFLKP